jgi:hypothetical protein
MRSNHRAFGNLSFPNFSDDVSSYHERFTFMTKIYKALIQSRLMNWKSKNKNGKKVFKILTKLFEKQNKLKLQNLKPNHFKKTF